VARTRKKSTWRPGKRIFANAKPASEAITRWMRVVPLAKMNVLRAHRQKLVRWNRNSKFPKNHCGGQEKSSTSSRKAGEMR
jgi:hypothetical protein